MESSSSEIERLIKVWATAITSLTYCYYISSNLSQGIPGLLSLLPIILLFTLLPLHLTTISLISCTSFFLTWLANFKLLLFSFNLGPLSSSPLPLSHFISIASLPIQPTTKTTPKPPKSPHNLTLKAALLALLTLIYGYKQQILSIHPNLLLAYYFSYIYISKELVFAILAITAASLLGLELEPQFDEPWLATSLQDFWGRRWNIMRPAVYGPVKRMCEMRWGLRRRGAALVAVVCTFGVSGLMHELIFFLLWEGEAHVGGDGVFCGARGGGGGGDCGEEVGWCGGGRWLVVVGEGGGEAGGGGVRDGHGVLAVPAAGVEGGR